jgi:hypothetical protein
MNELGLTEFNQGCSCQRTVRCPSDDDTQNNRSAKAMSPKEVEAGHDDRFTSVEGADSA